MVPRSKKLSLSSVCCVSIISFHCQGVVLDVYIEKGGWIVSGGYLVISFQFNNKKKWQNERLFFLSVGRDDGSHAAADDNPTNNREIYSFLISRLGCGKVEVSESKIVVLPTQTQQTILYIKMKFTWKVVWYTAQGAVVFPVHLTLGSRAFQPKMSNIFPLLFLLLRVIVYRKKKSHPVLLLLLLLLV